MFNLAENTKLRGVGYKLLNVLRVCNVVALLSVVVASWVMIVEESLHGQFYFFDAIAHVFTSAIAILLILTEVPFGFITRYVERSWPVFSCRDGFLWLGLALLVLACNVLACLNMDAFSSAAIGLPLWRLILASGILCLIFGVCNLVATVVFRDGATHLTARMIRADGNLADASTSYGSRTDMADYYSSSNTTFKRYHVSKEDESSIYPETTGGGGLGALGGIATNRIKRMTQAFNFRNTFMGGNTAKKMQISGPIIAHDDVHSASHGDSYTHTADADLESNDYHHEDRASPILPAVQRPPTALHPAMNLPASSRYSAANLSRF